MKRKSNGHTDDYLKRQAKDIQKRENISYLQALEKAAKNAGFNNWNHFVNSSKSNVTPSKEKVEKLRVDNLNQPDDGESKAINPYRNLLVAAINEVLDKNLITLNATTPPQQDGHVFVDLFGFPSVVLWQDIGFEELRISVWWKYNHSKHPQANLTGNARENFNGSSPLANRNHYKKFVGVVISGWLERKTGKYIQGKNNESIFDRYIRKGEKAELEKLPLQKTKGFKTEGKFHF